MYYKNIVMLFQNKSIPNISFTIHIFKEDSVFVAYVPELDLSSCGDTPEVARKNIHDAVRGFLETSVEMGTLQEVLEEAGYRPEGKSWRAPEFVSLDHSTLKLS